MKRSDDYILQNAANIDVNLSFVALADGLLAIAEELPATNVAREDGLTEQLGSLLARLLAEIDRKREQEERKREAMLAEMLANSNKASPFSPPTALAGWCVCVCVCVDLTDTYVYKCVRRSYISIYVCTYVIQIHLHISPTNAHVCRGRD
eukprot:Tamp_18668.p1 GENE.Tamp_18668~~Tamp_18668.p1  ORF type:complete len:150 (-),score=20.93 Tamp_18668:446-895(-)